MRITVDSLSHHLDVFLWENPEWSREHVVFEGTRVYARRIATTKGFKIEWEEKTIYDERDG
jgi:hypothetical protein